VSLYGEVQKEVIEDTLLTQYGIEVEFRETTPICIERPQGTGAAVEMLGKAPNPFLATVGLRVTRGELGSGRQFRLEVELGSMPLAFIRAVESTVEQTLHQGLSGWEVQDCIVTLTHAGYSARQSHSHATFDRSMSSTAADFRNLTPLVLMDALAEAGTIVYEPVHQFRLEVAAELLGGLLPVLSRMHAIPEAPVVEGSIGIVSGEIPTSSIYQLQQMLPSLSRGEGLAEVEFSGYRPAVGEIPTRQRWDFDPTSRRDYFQALGLSPAERARAGLG
jgi:ribosomal protection tetracycline resistance protein